MYFIKIVKLNIFVNLTIKIMKVILEKLVNEFIEWELQ